MAGAFFSKVSLAHDLCVSQAYGRDDAPGAHFYLSSIQKQRGKRWLCFLLIVIALAVDPAPPWPKISVSMVLAALSLEKCKEHIFVLYKGTSPKRKRSSPWDPYRTLGMGLW